MPFPSVYIEENLPPRRPIAPAATGIAGFVGAFADGPLDRQIVCRSVREFEVAFGAVEASGIAALQVRQFFLNGGTEARICRTDPASGIPAALSHLRGFDVLCAPDLEALPGADGMAAIAALHEVAMQARAFLVLDPPADAQSVAGIRAWRASLAAILGDLPEAAVYFPRLKAQIPGGTTVTIGASGTVAGIFARTDDARGVWKAPAGLEADPRGISGAELVIDEAQHDVLNPEGINVLRRPSGHGLRVWGARTLDGSGSSDRRYVPLRRLAGMITRSLEAGLQSAVFEPNDEPLWARLRLETGQFLQSLWQEGAFMGPKANTAYFCRCGPETMTAADMAEGRAVIEVGFAPLKQSEFLVLRIGVLTAGTG